MKRVRLITLALCTALTAGLDLRRFVIELEVERFVYVSSSMVFERATAFPTPEDHVWECPVPRSAYGFSKLTGEIYCRAAHEEHDLPYTICRPFNAYGPGELPDPEPGPGEVLVQTRYPGHPLFAAFIKAALDHQNAG